jgi:hypothetical protein
VARVAGAFVDVHLAPTARPALRTFAHVRAGRVHASSAMFAGISVDITLVYIVRTIDTLQINQSAGGTTGTH